MTDRKRAQGQARRKSEAPARRPGQPGSVDEDRAGEAAGRHVPENAPGRTSPEEHRPGQETIKQG